MKLKQLEYFRVICKYSNITRAAEELHVSQPSLSSVIRELEEEFQVPLFHRLSKGLVPTEQGKVLLEEAKLLLGQAEHLTARMQALVSENPVIRLGTPPMMATLIFPRLLRAFSARHPDIRVEMMEHGSLANRRLLLEGRLDAALISAAATPPATFGYRELGLADICFYVSRHHALAARPFLCPEDIQDTPLVLLGEDSFLASFVTRYFGEHGMSPRILLRTSQLATIRRLIESNTAATFLFDQVLEETGDIVKLPVRGFPPVPMFLIWNAGEPVSSATRKLIRLTEKGF